MDDLTHKGFTGSVDVSFEDGCLIGEVLFINDRIIYEGNTVGEIKSAFESAVDNYLEYCARHNKEPSKPYSGNFNIRPGADLHRSAAQLASRLKISLNEFVSQAIQDKVSSYATVNPSKPNVVSQNLVTTAQVYQLFQSASLISPQPNRQTNELSNNLIANYTQH